MKLFLFSLTSILVAGILAGVFWPSGPSIHFAGFQEGAPGRVASFNIINDTGSPYCFFGYAADLPFYRCKIQAASGWKTRGLNRCSIGSGWHTLAPHSVTRIQVPAPSAGATAAAPPSPFAVGIRFERGTAAQMYAGGHRPNFFSNLIFSLLEAIKPVSGDPEPTWSALVQP